jgi:hypothetical protein
VICPWIKPIQASSLTILKMAGMQRLTKAFVEDPDSILE